MYRKFYLLFLLSIFLFFEFFKFSFAEVREWGSYDYGFGSVTKEVPNNSRYRILTLDGGGIRGAFTAQILDMLEEELHFLQHVDFFAGTSTGAILACGLAYGISPKEIVEIFKTKGKDIFKVNRNILEILQLRPKYQIKSLKKALEDVFTPELTLSKLPKKVLCVSFDLYNPYYNNWTPALLDNFDSKASDQVSVVDAILRSTAAPTYFPSYQGYIDGGTIANNPTMMALTRALDIQGANQNLNNISLLSLGTGIASSYISGDEDWGTIEWMIKPSFNPSTPINPLIDITPSPSVGRRH